MISINRLEKDLTSTTEIARARKRILVDLDGVLFPYSKGYDDGSLYERPVLGAVEALRKLHEQGFTYVVFTTRMFITEEPEVQRNIIQRWLDLHKFPKPERITCEKMPCLAYIDDRAIRFTDWEDIRKLWT